MSNHAAKVFGTLDLEDALGWAAGGGLSIHLHRIVFSSSPMCFKRAVASGYPIAHVFHTDAGELRRLAQDAGVQRIVVEKVGETGQHVDLCGRPLRKLMAALGFDLEEYCRAAV